jgi:hypothetical protein
MKSFGTVLELYIASIFRIRRLKKIFHYLPLLQSLRFSAGCVYKCHLCHEHYMISPYHPFEFDYHHYVLWRARNSNKKIIIVIISIIIINCNWTVTRWQWSFHM